MRNSLPSFILLAFLVIAIKTSSQNVGIGTTNPQRQLHVAGDVRIDAFANVGNGIVLTNSSGDLSRLSLSNNATDVLKGNGTWGPVTGVVGSSGIVGSYIYNNSALLNAGYSLFGEIPGVLSYTTVTSTFGANTWQPNYTRGIVTNIAAPEFDNSGDPPMAIWNGTLMYVVTGTQVYTYNPVTDIWNIVSNQGVFNGVGTKAVWTGTEIVLWQGQLVTGKKYNPSTNIWTTMSLTNAPSARTGYSMIWNGSYLILWGGISGGVAVNTGAMYDPASNTWVTMNTAGAPAARTFHTAIWDDVSGMMIVWGGGTSTFSGEMNTGGLFKPGTNSWTSSTNSATAPAARLHHRALWTGTEMIIFGGLISGSPTNTGSRYNPSTDTWSATAPGPYSLIGHSVIWTGSAMFLTGGNTGTGSVNIAYSYNPVTNLWTYAGQFSSVEGKESHHSFLAGNIILVWGGKNVVNTILPTPSWTNTGYRYFLTPTASSATTISSNTLYLYQKN